MSLDRRTILRTRTDDDVELVADLWLPDGAGPWPVLLQRLPYGRAVASSIVLAHPAHLARLGYAVVVQDSRGCGSSGGRFTPYVDEAEDGRATIEWLAGRPFCDGRVVTYGFSYQGLAQLYAAGTRPAGLVALAPFQCAPAPGEGWTFDGGCMRWDFVATWAAQLIGLDGVRPRTVDQWALPTLDAIPEPRPTWWTDWLERPPGAAWDALAPGEPDPTLPSLVVGGWHDTFAAGSSRLAVALGAGVVFGPWAHIPWGTRHATGDHGPDASPRIAHDRFTAFLAHVLDDGPEPADRVDYLTIGAGWRRSATWPVVDRPTDRWIAAGGHANSRHGDGRLGPDVAPSTLPDVIVAEPLEPVPGGLDPMTDERGVEDRRDVLCFTSDPLRDPLVLTGSVSAAVSVRADVVSHDLVVTLAGVAPDGSSIRMATGARRLAPAQPGVWRTTTVDLPPISWLLPTGWRLRLDVSPSRFPAYDRNPQTGAISAHAQRRECSVATIEIRGLTIDLPVE